MKIIIKTIFAFAAGLLLINSLKAQEKRSDSEKSKQAVSDSLYMEISTTIYYSFYATSYMSTNTPTFAILKIDFDKNSKVTAMGFSDSADSSFVKAFENRKKWHDDKATLERYAKVKSYKNLSLLIPVSYEPQLPNSTKYYTNDYLESYFKFDKKNFTGNAIMESPIFIKVSAKGEM
ncbi:hypothetical protein [Mucilaginibacter sp. SG564]|uniref:hypothetical protein n=1 Tax=Mucilaginibacter sp. SG564 TaxID=2587022 RepID=UPI001551BC2A|nr:hypothetical protein [Mucilaginibacter sp. SG564]NOW96538.1 hypothetical protein [Mucilaginibacter sp. SG564]